MIISDIHSIRAYMQDGIFNIVMRDKSDNIVGSVKLLEQFMVLSPDEIDDVVITSDFVRFIGTSDDAITVRPHKVSILISSTSDEISDLELKYEYQNGSAWINYNYQSMAISSGVNLANDVKNIIDHVITRQREANS